MESHKFSRRHYQDGDMPLENRKDTATDQLLLYWAWDVNEEPQPETCVCILSIKSLQMCGQENVLQSGKGSKLITYYSA